MKIVDSKHTKPKAVYWLLFKILCRIVVKLMEEALVQGYINTTLRTCKRPSTAANTPGLTRRGRQRERADTGF